jgi:hypothetical protein
MPSSLALAVSTTPAGSRKCIIQEACHVAARTWPGLKALAGDAGALKRFHHIVSVCRGRTDCGSYQAQSYHLEGVPHAACT